MKNYYILDYDKPFINEQIVFPQINSKAWNTFKVTAKETLCTDGIDYLTSIKFYPWHHFNFFIGAPDLTCDVHIDSLTQSYALNYIWGDSKSTMRWFYSDEPGIDKDTTAGTGYLNFNNAKVELIEEIEVPHNKLMLVRTDIPHNVTNHSNNPRYCISVRGYPVAQWEDAVKYFSPHFT